jgi:non-specific serine/threonine protein kinase
MRPTDGAQDAAIAGATTIGRRPWHKTLRALREARGVTQEGWAALLGVSRKTVQRWESGARAPDPGAEAAILRYCQEAGLFRAFARGPLAGRTLTEGNLRDVFAEARWHGPGHGAPPQSRPPDGAPEPDRPGEPGGPNGAVAPAPAAQSPAAATTSLPVQTVQTTNLPAPLTSFVGREEELAAVRRVQAGTRLLTLTGAGGCGKTRLALAVADELRWAYPHGVWFVDLAPLSEQSLLPAVVAAALAVRTTGQQQPMEALLGALRSRRLLLLLDNCEHLLPACAVLAETLLRACPYLEVVITSREPLGILGETVWRVPPLAVPPEAPVGAPGGAAPGVATSTPGLGTTDAEQLFVERARLRRPGFVPTLGDAAGIAEICRRLDGIPLAIELAAARTSVLSVEQIAARLDDRFRLLTGGTRAALPRQQTLRAAMDWSYDLLTAQEQATLRALSVFAGGFTLEAAEAVCDFGFWIADFGLAASSAESRVEHEPQSQIQNPKSAIDVLDLLAHLVDKSLVFADEQGQVVRYRVLQTVRQYAAECLEQSGEATQARARHAQYFLDLAEQAAPEVMGPDQARWHAHLETERDNLRAALAWSVEQGDAPRALRFATALRWFWYRQRHWDEGSTWPARVLALPGAQELTPLRAEVLEGAGLFAMWREPAAAQAMWEESIAIDLQHGRPARAAQTHVFLAWLLIRLWRLEEAHARAETAVSLAEAAGDAGRRAIALALLAAVAARRGEHAAARAHHAEALALRHASGDVSGQSLLLLDMAKAAFLAGDGPLARTRAEEALRAARGAGIRQAVEEELRLITRVALAQGDLATAAARATELVEHVQGQGLRAEADALAVLGQVTQAGGDPAGAAARYREALELARRLADPGEAHPVLYRDTGDQPGVALALEGTAGLCAPAAPAPALHLAGAADALRVRARQPLTAAERAALDRALAAAREALGLDEAEQAWAAGTAAAIEDVIALALEALPVSSEGKLR